MILTAHQPVYLPWLGLFHKIAMADLFISFDQVQYLKKDWNNRNKIKSHQGPVWLTVPVLSKGHYEKRICDIEINNSLPWARKHWRTINTAYSKAPYFKRYASFFEDLYNQKWNSLNELNIYMLKWFLITLGIKVPVKSAEKLHFKGTKSDLVLDMCNQVGADHYIFGALGKDYADQPSFEQACVSVHFQNYIHPVYPQLHGDFVSHLSIIDLLFNCGDESLDRLLCDNVTRTDLMGGRAC